MATPTLPDTLVQAFAVHRTNLRQLPVRVEQIAGTVRQSTLALTRALNAGGHAPADTARLVALRQSSTALATEIADLATLPARLDGLLGASLDTLLAGAPPTEEQLAVVRTAGAALHLDALSARARRLNDLATEGRLPPAVRQGVIDSSALALRLTEAVGTVLSGLGNTLEQSRSVQRFAAPSPATAALAPAVVVPAAAPPPVRAPAPAVAAPAARFESPAGLSSLQRAYQVADEAVQTPPMVPVTPEPRVAPTGPRFVFPPRPVSTPAVARQRI